MNNNSTTAYLAFNADIGAIMNIQNARYNSSEHSDENVSISCVINGEMCAFP